ncbi:MULTISPECIES: SDR family NAD(P)-dependent oxidoreductase [unclassified Oceanobacillus]|uniref:SDR family NAD(P)-dependent oxidoreductase n=1 Tax=unclassified Oceanobacillus TaxID=2630292 RepID=UPI00300E3789
MCEVNVFEGMAITKTVLPSMTEKNSDYIINVPSKIRELATPKSNSYAAIIQAVLSFINSLRMELETNVNVSAASLSPLETSFLILRINEGTTLKM